MVLQAAIDGLGVALGRSVLVADDLAAGRLVKPFPLELPTSAAYHIACPEGTQDRPKVKAFRDWVMSEVARDAAAAAGVIRTERSEEHTSELQSLMRISYAVFCLKKKKHN